MKEYIILRVMKRVILSKAILFLLLPGLCLISLNSCKTATGSKKFIAHKGVLDLRGYSFDEKKPIPLHGEWEFYWNSFVEPANFKGPAHPPVDSYAHVPGNWGQLVGKDNDISLKGYGTYRLRILHDKLEGNFSIKSVAIGCAFMLFVNNEEIASGGKIGKSMDASEPGFYTDIDTFTLSGNYTDIIVHVASFHNWAGGIWGAFPFGRERDVRNAARKGNSSSLFLIGALIIMAFYHFALFAIRPKEKGTIVFGFFCVILAIRGLVVGDYYLIHMFPDISFHIVRKIEYLTLFLGSLTIVHFFHLLFKEDSKKIVLNIIAAITITGALLVIFFPTRIFTYTVRPVQILIITLVLYVFVINIIGIVKKREGAIIFIIGTLVFDITMVNDVLYTSHVIDTGHYFPFGMMFFILCQALLLSMRFLKAFNAVEVLSSELEGKNMALLDLNQNLEQKVLDRTEELQAAYDKLSAINEHLNKAKDALWGEMQIAKKIQTVLLPENPAIKGYEIAAYMNPADDVGGDYYDIINMDDRDWIIIGDVSGHGVPAGLIMMMVQTAIHSVITNSPVIHPQELLKNINHVIWHNISRISGDKYMTITVLASIDDSHFTFSGLHQDILIYRAGTSSIDTVHTDGVWLGMLEDIGHMLSEDTIYLNKNDVLLLYTDGITEAWVKGSESGKRDPHCDMYGKKRLINAFRDSGNKGAQEIIDALLSSMNDYDCDDDLTLMAIKRID